MSGSLGELVISLSADMAKFRADMGQAQKVTNDTMQKISSDMDKGVAFIQGSLKDVSKAFAAVTAVAAGGAVFADVINSTKAWTGEVVRLSKVMGSSLADASAYNVALRLTGNDTETALQVTAKLTKTLATNQAAFAAHGIAIKDSSGHLLGQQQIITNTFDALSKLKSGTDRNTAAQELLGRSFLQLSGMAKITNQVLQESKELSNDLGLTIDGKTSEAVKKYSYEMNKLKLVHEAFKVNVGELVLEPLLKVEQAFNKVAIAAAKAKSKDGMGETFTLNLASLVLMEQRLNSKEFLLHPIDTVQKLTADLQKMKKVADAAAAKPPEAPATGGTNDPTSAADRKAAAAAAKAAIEAQRQHYNQGVALYNSFIDDLTRNDPSLSAHAKKIAEIQQKVDDAAKEYPGLAADIRAVGQDMIDQANAAKTLAEEIANLRAENALLEESTKDMTGFGGFAKGLGMDALKLPQIGGKLGKDGGLTGGMPKFSLTGKSETGGLLGRDTSGLSAPAAPDNYLDRLGRDGQFDGMVNRYKAMFDEIKAAEEKFGKDSLQSQNLMWGSRVDMVRDGVGMISTALMQGNKEQFAAGKALAMAMAVVDGAMAVQKALASAPPPMNFASAALVAAASAIQFSTIASAQFQARERGGPVRAGETYLVGEKGPELMTAAADGYVTPNHMLGGTTYAPTFNIDARGSNLTEAQVEAIASRAADRGKAEILSSMNRGGSFAVASGRR